MMNFLKFNLCVLLCILVGVFCGCGSDSGSGAPAVKKAQKTPAEGSPKVLELLTGKSKGDKVRETSALSVSQGVVGSKDIPVLPPSKPGGKPITQAEIDAGLAKLPPVDPKTREVIPPSKPGEKGVTQVELDASLRNNEQKPQRIEVLPPEVPGGKGFTQKEINDSLAKSIGKESQEPEVIPSPITGGPGVTQREVKASMPVSNPDISPIPPKQSSSTGNPPTSPPNQSGVPR